jgi:hypothetical protein
MMEILSSRFDSPPRPAQRGGIFPLRSRLAHRAGAARKLSMTWLGRNLFPGHDGRERRRKVVSQQPGDPAGHEIEVPVQIVVFAVGVGRAWRIIQAQPESLFLCREADRFLVQAIEVRGPDDGIPVASQVPAKLAPCGPGHG